MNRRFPHTLGLLQADSEASGARRSIFSKTKMCKFHLLGVCAKAIWLGWAVVKPGINKRWWPIATLSWKMGYGSQNQLRMRRTHLRHPFSFYGFIKSAVFFQAVVGNMSCKAWNKHQKLGRWTDQNVSGRPPNCKDGCVWYWDIPNFWPSKSLMTNHRINRYVEMDQNQWNQLKLP